MKKLFTLLAFLTVMLTINARTDTVYVCTKPSWLQYGNLVDTLSDGTILYFYRSGNTGTPYFSGAVGTASSLTLPDSLFYESNSYLRVFSSYNSYSSSYPVDYSNMPNLTELTLPATVSSIHQAIPSSITDLHLQRINDDVYISDSSYVSPTTIVWVPYSSLSFYRTSQYASTGKYRWTESHNIHYEGWQFNALSVNVAVPGTFSQVMVNVIDQWYDVDELTVSGSLNATDYTFFNRLTEMTKLDLSQTNITTIGGLAGLLPLRDVILPTSVVNIEANAFEGCKGLRNINVPNVITVNNYAFRYCWDLIIDNLPSAVTIGQDAFYDCDAIRNMSLPVATSIGSYAFDGCNSLETFSAPLTTTIGSSAFSGCSTLDSVYLPNVELLSSSAFSSCSSLRKISLPKADEIGGSAFNSCTSLQSVSLPSVSIIGYYAFQYCNSLTSVLVSSRLSSLGYDVFGDEYDGLVTSLRHFYCYATTPVSTNSFTSTVVGNATLHVPAYSVNSYLAHSDWYLFQNIVPLDTVVDKLIINTDFILTTQTGLTDTIAMEITETGRLTVNTDSALYISNYVQSCTPLYYDSYYDYDTYSYVYDYWKCSSLIVHDTVTADTVTFKVSVKKNAWNFLSFPVDIDVFDIDVPAGTGWVIRKYSGLDRACLTGNTWQDVTDGMTLNAGQGYIFNCTNSNSSDTYIEFTLRALNNGNKNRIFQKGNVSQFLNTYVADMPHNSSWNLVGNPFPCFFNSDSIQHNGVITVWNGTGYTAYSLLDDHYCLRPFEAFFVQCPEDANAMIFKEGGRTDSYTEPTQVLNAPAFSTLSAGGSRYVYNLTLSNDSSSDRTRFVLNEAASLDYEISSDASKFLSGDNATPQIYVMENGQRFAIDERPLANGQIDLGVYIAQPGEYTIALKSNPDDETYPILTDKLNGNRTNLTTDSYKFQATAGYSDERFIITFDRIPTGVDNAEGETTCLESGDIYSMDGRFIMHIDSRSELQNLGTGVYVIKSGDITEKISIK